MTKMINKTKPVSNPMEKIMTGNARPTVSSIKLRNPRDVQKTMNSTALSKDTLEWLGELGSSDAHH